MTATPGETGPVFDQPTVPETFGYDQPPLVEPDPAAFTPTPVSAEGPVVEAGARPGCRRPLPSLPPPKGRRRVSGTP